MYLFFSAVVIALLVFMVWRLSSRRHSIPCPVWLHWLVELDNPFAKAHRAAIIVERLGLQPGMTVLDAGCGPGRLTVPIARRIGEQGEVMAMDIQPGMIERVREKAQAANLTNIRYLQAGLGENRLDRDRFDRAVLVTVLGEIPNREAALQEIYDAVKSGGILSITEIVFDPHFQSRRTVARLAGAVGFIEHSFFGNRIAYTVLFRKPLHG